MSLKNNLIESLSVIVGSAVFAVCVSYIGFSTSPYVAKYTGTSRLTSDHYTLMLIVVTVAVIAFLPVRHTKSTKWKTAFWLFAILLAFPFAVTKIIFGNNELEAILIFFRDNQLQDMAAIGADSFIGPITVSLIVLLVLILTSLYLVIRKQWVENMLLVGGVIFLLISPITLFSKNTLMQNSIQTSYDFANEIALDVTKRPDVQKNLIVVYLESLERTYGELEATKAVFQPLKILASEAVEGTNIHQTVGTEFTIAGIVASQCGIPLVPQGLKSIFFKKKTEGISSIFLPKITCMGDILSDDGYQVSYLNGASLDRFSKRTFFLTHGYDRAYGLEEAPQERINGRTNAFGMNDALLFEMVREEYDRLIKRDDPFALNLLTVSTHGPDAFLDNNCAFDEGGESKLPEAINCTIALLEEFIAYTEAHGNGRETEIVIMSDHLAMRNTLSKDLINSPTPRRNLFFMKGSHAPAIIERNATAMDIFPTIMEQMGYRFANDQANLGRSMFSDQKNLIERYGPRDLTKLLKGNHALAEYIWRTDDSTQNIASAE